MKTKKGLWRRIWQLLVVCMLLAAALFCVLEGIVIAGSGSSKNQDADVVVVLGAMVYQRGPSPVLVQRMDTALSYLETHPDTVVVASGGQREDERESEARAIAGYLTEKGVAQDRILLEEQSVNTYQNLSNSAALLEEKGYDLDATRILVVSNGFHLVRVRMLAKRCGLQIGTLSAPMPDGWRNTVYCYSRETLALVKSFFMDRGSPGAMVSACAWQD